MQRFADLSYEVVGLREIAEDAGFDAALVSRYYRSKEQLFRAAVAELADPSLLIAGERSTFGRRIAEAAVEAHLNPRSAVAPMMALLRAAGSPTALPIVQEVQRELFFKPLAEWLGGEDAELRAFFISSILSGILLNRYFWTDILVDRHTRGRYVDRLATALQAQADGATIEPPQFSERSPDPAS